MKEGIKAQQRIWTNLKIKEADQLNNDDALTPDQEKMLQMARTKLKTDVTQGWDDLIDAMDITD